MPSPASAFEFAPPERIVFGPGRVTQAGTLTASLGNSALLVTGRDVRRAEPVRESFRSAGLNWVEWAVAGEPTVSEVRAGAEAARSLDRRGTAVDHRIGARMANPSTGPVWTPRLGFSRTSPGRPGLQQHEGQPHPTDR